VIGTLPTTTRILRWRRTPIGKHATDFRAVLGREVKDPDRKA
jgi:hypothetical protein